MRDLVRKVYGETVSWDPDTGERVETPPELQAQLDAAFDHSIKPIRERLAAEGIEMPSEDELAKLEPFEQMMAWVLDTPSGSRVVIGTRADAEARAGIMKAAGKEELMLSGPYEFTIAVKP